MVCLTACRFFNDKIICGTFFFGDGGICVRDFHPCFDETTNILNSLFKFQFHRNSFTGLVATFSSSHVGNTTFSTAFNSLPAEKKSDITVS